MPKPMLKPMPKNMLSKISSLWSKVPASWKTELVSAWHTFVAAFVAVMAMHYKSFETGDFSMSLVQSAFLAALRSGVKAVFQFVYMLIVNKFFPPLKKSKD